MDPALAARASGGIATTAQLRARGVSERAMSEACRGGVLLRLRRGWYALPGTHPELCLAVRTGGSLTCVSALGRLGAWTPTGSRVHVALPVNASRWRHRVSNEAAVVIHWRGGGRAVLDSVPAALRAAATCLTLDELVAVLDSCLRLRLISRSALARLGLPARAVRLADASADSGGESVVRLRLRAMRCRFVTQARIPGVGRVDFLIGDRLVIEVDGYSVHGDREAFERDRARDLELVALGYIVIRVSYRQIEHDWPRIERLIRAILRSRRHLDRTTRSRQRG